MNIQFEPYDWRDEDHQLHAAEVVQWSQTNSMLPLTMEAMRHHRYGLLAVGAHLVPLGYVAVTEVQADTATVGGLVINPNFRRRGIGVALVQQLLGSAALPAAATYQAFANQASLRLFTVTGGVVVGPRPFDPYAIDTGCNFVVDLTPVVQQAQS